MTDKKPLSSRELKSKKLKKAKSPPNITEDITICSFSMPKGVEPTISRDWQNPNGYQVNASVSKKQIEKHGQDLIKPVASETIATTQLDKTAFEQFRNVDSIRGSRNEYAAARVLPKASKLDVENARRFKEIKDGDDLPTNVFGTDDRYIYNDSSFPWRTVGRVWTANGVCAGCTIGPRLVLTASHCINWLSGGGAGWVKFSPAYYNGNGPWGEYYATRVVYWNKAQGGLSDLETAFDYVVLVMNDYLGNSVGYPGYRTYSSSWNDLDSWQHMGYPGDLTSTQRPAYVGNCSISSTSSQSTAGQSGLVLGHFNDITGGHSGGPIWGWWEDEDWPRVVGVQSAEASTPAFNTSGDNEFGGGSGLSALISWARSNYP